MKKKTGIVFSLLLAAIVSLAQTRTIGIKEAVQLGVQNSKQLKLSQYKSDEANAQLEQAKDATKPTVKASAGYSHALMLAQTLTLPAADGQQPKPTKFPFDFPLYQANASITEPIFAGNKLKYARMSASLLLQMSKLDIDKDKDEVIYTIAKSYINYYKIRRNQDIVAQNLQDIDNKLQEIIKFEGQGLATKNDVLRYQLQKSNTELTILELEDNRKIVNYNLNIMLGLPDGTVIEVPVLDYKLDSNATLEQYLPQALKDRKEFSTFNYQTQLADLNIKKIHDERLPTLGVNGTLYYFNLSKAFIPKSGDFLAPFVIGINASWDITNLFKMKNRLSEANIQKQQVAAMRDIQSDQVKMEVNQYVVQYRLSLDKIRILLDAVTQATENERIMESKFRNNLATTTDRIDAQTLLYQSRVNLELAKADATGAYYNLLKSTGHIQP